MKPKLLTPMMALLFAVLLSLTSDGAEKTGQIRGQIVAASDGSPISGAHVMLMSPMRTTISDINGYFQIDSLPPGEYILHVTNAGFYDAQINASVSKMGRDRLLNVVMRRKDAPRKESPVIDTEALSKALESSLKKDDAAGSSKSGRVEAPAPYIVQRMAITDGNYKTDNPSQQLTPMYRPQPTFPEIYSQPYDMFFQDYGTNGFVDTRRDRFSTFGADVDDASYNLAKRYLLEGHMPPQDAIRVEEFVNHFDYGYAPPEDRPFRIFTELAASPFYEKAALLKLGIKGRELTNRERRPLNLTMVIDCSGSMGYDTRLELVKQAMHMLVNQLNGRDKIGIVAYSSSAWVVLNPTSVANRRAIFNALDGLYPRTSTFAEAGLRLGYRMAEQQYVEAHNNLVVLCSDGVANVGETNPDAIMRDIKRFATKGIILSTFGVGMGNYNDVLLEKLAREGNGRYAYINDIDEARKQFCEQLTGNLQVLGRDMKIQVEFNPQVVASYRLLGYEKRAVPDQKFRDNNQDGGEVGSGHEVTALYEVILTGRRNGNIGTVAVRWKNPGQDEVTEVQKDISFGDMCRSFDSARPEFQLAFVAAKFAESLKGTRYSDRYSLGDLSVMARSIAGDLDNEQARELADLIQRAGALSDYSSVWRD
jgi:Ca-activated chloride channel family protein